MSFRAIRVDAREVGDAAERLVAVEKVHLHELHAK